MDLDQGSRQDCWQGSGVSQGLSGGIGAGDATDQALQGAGSAEPLQIPHQGQAAVGLAPPAEGLTVWEAHLQLHRLTVVREALQLPPPAGAEPQARQACRQQIGIAQHCGQDGEMGHGGHGRCERR